MRKGITPTDVDRIVEQETTDAWPRAVWRKFVCLAGTEMPGVLFAEPTDSVRLAEIYRTRAALLRQGGSECGGFDESVGALEAAGGAVCLALLKAPQYLGVCFLTPALDRLIGFLYFRHEQHLPL
jgi:hypothetical protein